MSTSPEDLEGGTPQLDEAGDEPEPAADAVRPEPDETNVVQPDPSAEPPYTHTRASGVWAAVVTSLVVLVILIVFILENPRDVRVDFFGAHGSLPLGVALLLAAVIGGLVVVMFGTARILQLRHRARRQHRLFKAKNAPPSPSQ